MAYQAVDIGASPNDGTGDPLRDAFDKINDNFVEVYAGLTGLLDFKGSTDCSANPNYPAASKGDYYLVSVAGKIGGASGTVVGVGDSYFATADNAGGNQATVGTSWTVVEGNLGYAPVNKAGDTMSGALHVPDDAYDATTWNASTEVPTKNAVRDKIEAVIAGVPSSYTDEMARDAIGAALTDTGLAVVTVNDGGDTIDISVPAAAASDINTGTDTAKALTADALAGSNLGTAAVSLLVSDPNGSAITTGDGKCYFRVPSSLNGMNLIAVAASVDTVSSSGIPTVQLRRKRSGSDVDMLSTKLTIDASETDSSTAAAAAVIDASNDDVATGDRIYIDIDVAGTGAKGLAVEMQFRLP